VFQEDVFLRREPVYYKGPRAHEMGKTIALMHCNPRNDGNNLQPGSGSDAIKPRNEKDMEGESWQPLKEDGAVGMAQKKHWMEWYTLV
jgi:hypothetical protein